MREIDKEIGRLRAYDEWGLEIPMTMDVLLAYSIRGEKIEPPLPLPLPPPETWHWEAAEK